MTSRRRLAATRAAYAALVGVGLLRRRKRHTTDIAVAPAVAVGGAVGAALFALLEGGRPRLHPPRREDGPLLAVAGVAAASEEILWRRGLLESLRPHTGTAAALVGSALAFGAAHPRPRAASTFARHAVIGVVFGSTLLATGRLAAATTAHLVYDTLVVLAEIDDVGP